MEASIVVVVSVLLAGLVVIGGFALLAHLRADKPTGAAPKPVDRYVISMSEGDFPQILLSLQLDDGQIHGPYAFVPAFAFTLSDEMTIAAARAAPKRSSRQVIYDEAIGKIETMTDDAPEYSRG